MEKRVLKQLNNLALSYNSLVQIMTKLNLRERTSNNTKVHSGEDPLFDGHKGSQARSFQLDFFVLMVEILVMDLEGITIL